MDSLSRKYLDIIVVLLCVVAGRQVSEILTAGAANFGLALSLVVLLYLGSCYHLDRILLVDSVRGGSGYAA